MSYKAVICGAAFVAGVFAIHACGGGDPAGPGATPVASVAVSPTTHKLAPQQSVQLSAVPKDADGNALTGRSISWTTSQAGKAQVSSTGMVTAMSDGVVTITASSEGKSGSAQITIESPVAAVEISAAATTLVPQQTMQLNLTLRDGGGATLTGRPVNWTSSQTQVASISQSGMLTAVATGTTTITAAVEGKNGSIALSVVEGAVVGTGGGTVTVGNGTIVVTIPPGAVPTSTVIFATPVGSPAGAQPANFQRFGTTYKLGPAGVTFAQPITVTMKFNPADVPTWAMGGDLSVIRNAGGQWGALTNIAVDLTAGTVSGKTSGFVASPLSAFARYEIAAEGNDGSDHSIGAIPPQVILTPASDSVSTQKRSVILHASLLPRGAGLSMPATTPAPAPQWKYRWRTTGQRGVLGGGGTTTGWTTSPDEQYIATFPALNDLSGQIDLVFVDVLLNPEAENTPSQQRIVTAQASIFAGLKTTYELSPSNKTIGAGVAQDIQLVVRDQNGNQVQPHAGARLTWTSSSNQGSLGATTPGQTTVTYTSKSTFNSPPPRVDDVKATIEGVTTVTERQVVWDFSMIPPKLVVEHTTTETRDLKGEAKGFITVKVDYEVKLEPATNTVSVGGTKQLQVTLTPAYDGPGIEYKYTYSGTNGQLNVASGVRTPNKQPTYTAKNFSNGGTDQISVEVVSVVGGTQLESIGNAQASVEVDPWRTGLIGPDQLTTQFGTWFTSAQIRVAKVAGATSYEVKAETPDGLYTKTFSGATSTNVNSVNEVLDGGTHWLINIEAGFNSIESAADARWNIYFNKYKDVVVKYKATQ